MSLRRPRRITLTPTLDTNAYATGDQVSTLQTLSGLMPDHGAGEIKQIVMLDKAKQSAALDLFFFDSSSVTLASDNSAFAISDADMLNCIGVVNILSTDYDVIGSTSSIATITVPFMVQPRGNGPTIYMAIVSRGTPTYAASDLVFQFFAEART